VEYFAIKQMNELKFINELFALLAANKKFPSYQAERRIDIFINFFLEDILTHHFPGSEVSCIAPEFPLKKESSNQSTNVDYLCVRKTGQEQRILFVELKTDTASFDKKQFETYLHYQNNKTWKDCVAGLEKIALSKNLPYTTRIKYYNLFKTLFNSGLVSARNELFEQTDELIRRIASAEEQNKQKYKIRFSGLFRDFSFTSEPMPVNVVYLAPGQVLPEKHLNRQQVLFIQLDRISEKLPTEYPEIWRKFSEMLRRF
jgi:hypothetical protein